ncbi:uncharacterized protein LOC119071412 [Bradysia coprophila]|uniref:uncharacterized protein LOC119071412 n=1 Tax=Bradysia coprophila TaxID=38358 RepID=UPI00187DC27F|nr:uncharacterized protein LOC119071412 [Bradysia coprophila]
MLHYETVEKVLREIDLSKGQGPDFIPPIFLRECAESLAPPLSLIYEKSLFDSVYPDKMKLSQITAIYKKGKKTDVSNYRGAAVMPNLAKIFERVVYEQAKLIICPRLSKRAHGFVTYEIGAQVDTFYSDVSKAFDTVDQPLSIRKLAHFPLGNRSLRWFNSYSAKRKHRVRVGREISDEFDAHSAIGQGTILGPILFLTFFDDSDAINETARSYNFADDKKKAKIVTCLADTVKLQECRVEYNLGFVV